MENSGSEKGQVGERSSVGVEGTLGRGVGKHWDSHLGDCDQLQEQVMASGRVRWGTLLVWPGALWSQTGDSPGGQWHVRGTHKTLAWEHLGSTGGLSLQWLWSLLSGTYCVPGTVVNVLLFNHLKSSVGQMPPSLAKLGGLWPCLGRHRKARLPRVVAHLPWGPKKAPGVGCFGTAECPSDVKPASPVTLPGPPGTELSPCLVLPFPRRLVSDPCGWGRASTGHGGEVGIAGRGLAFVPSHRTVLVGARVEEGHLRACECF